MSEKQEIIWPEWNDSDVNAEKWDMYPRSKTAGKPAKTPKSKGSAKTSAATSVATVSPDLPGFEDNYPVPLPESIRHSCDNWIKLSALYPGMKIVVFAPETGYPDLISHNRNVFCSEFMRSFITAMYNLMYLGYVRPSAVEWPTPGYNANTSNHPWKPWHHVYSLCKAGEGTHNPQTNNSGKYIVRLFWMGCWRKVVVDERVPVDKNLRIILPTTPNTKGHEMELWPLLLTKALLKIASLTWTSEKELVDFDIIAALTGWALQKINTEDLEMIEKWEMITGFADHFSWDETDPEKPKGKKGKGKGKGKGKKEKKEKESKKGSKKGKGKGSKKGKTSNVPAKNALPEINSFHMVAVCKSLMEFDENAIQDITPCISHGFLIDKTRDIPLLREPDPSKILPKWKEFRWVEWATRHGLWVPEEKPETIKYCKIISNLRKVSDDPLLDRQPSKNAEDIKKSVELIDKYKKKKGKGKDKEKKEKKSSKSSKSSKGSKKSKDSKGKKKGKQPAMPEDPSIWTHFFNIAPYITSLNIYLRPSKLSTNIVITDLIADTRVSKKSPRKDDKKAEPLKRIQWLNGLKRSHNEPIYLFADTADYKFLVFNLQHVGNVMPNEIPKDADKDKKICLKEVCKSGMCVEGCICQDMSIASDENEEEEDTRVTGNLIIEEYRWQKRTVENFILNITTYGTKSVTIDFEPGRFIWRLWLKSPTNLFLTILSDINLVVGTVEDILDAMTNESEIIIKYTYDISSAFGNLIKDFAQPDFLTSKRNYYKCYQPPENELDKTETNTLHDAYMEEFLKLLGSLISEPEKVLYIRALRCLFLDPTLKFPGHEILTPHKDYSASDIDEFCVCVDKNEVKRRERAAVLLQSYFKMIYIKKLKLKHLSYNPKFPPIFDVLRQIYMTLFGTKVRMNTVPILLRNLVQHISLEDIKYSLPYYNEMGNVIYLQTFAGSLENLTCWVPLCRLNILVDKSTLIRPYLNSDLPDYVVRIINNDNYEETPIHTNTALVSEYYRNRYGYSVVAYGWSEDNEECDWSLKIITEKMNSPAILVRNEVINSYILGGEYIPHINNKVFKVLVKTEDTSLLTFRLSVSSPNVKIRLKCINKDGEVINEIIGTTKMILPIVLLKKDVETSSSRFSLPLTDDSAHSPTKKLGRNLSLSRSSIKKLKSKSDKKSDRKSTSSIGTAISYAGRRNTRSRHSTDSYVFYVEAYVIDDSWPLTEEEWERVDERRARDYVEEELIANANKSASPTAARTSTNSKMLQKPSKLIKNSKNFEELLAPMWFLEAVYSKNQNIVMEKDRTRQEEIKEIKRQCFNYLPDRLLEGKRLRQEYLNQYIVIPKQYEAEFDFEEEASKHSNKSSLEKSNSSLQRDQSKTSKKRSSSKVSSQSNASNVKSEVCPECHKSVIMADVTYTVQPQDSKLRLPPYNINRIFEFDYYRRVLTEEDFARFLEEQEFNLQQFQEYYEKAVQAKQDYYDKDNEKMVLIEEWYSEIWKETEIIMTERDEAKQKYIKRIKEEEAAAAGGKKDKKGKKGKKGKKK